MLAIPPGSCGVGAWHGHASAKCSASLGKMEGVTDLAAGSLDLRMEKGGALEPVFMGCVIIEHTIVRGHNYDNTLPKPIQPCRPVRPYLFVNKHVVC